MRTSEAIEEQQDLPEQEPEDSGLITAPLPARLLAAIVDYLVVTALLFAASTTFGYGDFQFLIPLLFGGLYLSVGNSELMSGQTLGKRAFGLRVLSSKSAAAIPYVNLSRSVLRFLGSFGILILGTELPPLIYRSQAFIASSYVLELHMFLLLLYSFANIALAVFDPLHRALHDRIAGTIVVRGRVSTDGIRAQIPSLPISKLRCFAAVLFAIFLSSVLWFLGGVHDPRLGSLVEKRYVIEHQFPVRVLSVQMSKDGPELFMLSIDSDTPLEQTARAIGAFVVESPRGNPETADTISLTMIDPNSDSQEPASFLFDTVSMELQ